MPLKSVNSSIAWSLQLKQPDAINQFHSAVEQQVQHCILSEEQKKKALNKPALNEMPQSALSGELC